MRIAVLGAGVTGLTTAYFLARDGHQVEVVERNDGVAREASFANGAQLSYSYVAPLAGPSVLPKIPPWLLRADSPLRFFPQLDPQQWLWLLEFVLACNRKQSESSTQHLLELSFFSRRLMHTFVKEEEAIDFGYAKNGKLVLYSDQASFEAARRLLDFQRQLGCEQAALMRGECLALEPAIAHPTSTLAKRIVGGIHTPSEEVGDCYRFCTGLEKRLKSLGVVLRFNTTIRALEAKGGKLSAVITDAGKIGAEQFVLSLGTQSPHLVRPLGLRLPIYPLKGYSITLPLPEGGAAPRLSVSITDFARKIVYAPIAGAGGEALRVAGMADIAGYSSDPDPARLGLLFKEAQAAFPAATDYSRGPQAMQPWAGLRPATPKGTPLLGRSAYANLILNCGHGALGWTLALGSARIAADLIAGNKPALDIGAFRIGRH